VIGDVAAALVALAVWRLIVWVWPPKQPGDGDEPDGWPDHWW
jgi:hypothetical protein